MSRATFNNSIKIASLKHRYLKTMATCSKQGCLQDVVFSCVKTKDEKKGEAKKKKNMTTTSINPTDNKSAQVHVGTILENTENNRT